MTEKLFYQDPYLREFTALVVDCQQAKTGWRVALDRTAFYPEGGGQPGDTGMLNDVTVTDTHEKEGVVLHYTQEPIPVGTQVTGAINWGHRFDLMQQHSGEHMVSGLIHKRFGYDNVGFHLGSDLVTIDFNGELTEQDLRDIEAEANRAIWADREVCITWPDSRELAALDYRSKKELMGAVRIVEFPQAEYLRLLRHPCAPHRRDRPGEADLLPEVPLRCAGGDDLRPAGAGLAEHRRPAKPSDRRYALRQDEQLRRGGAPPVRREPAAEGPAGRPAGQGVCR